MEPLFMVAIEMFLFRTPNGSFYERENLGQLKGWLTEVVKIKKATVQARNRWGDSATENCL